MIQIEIPNKQTKKAEYLLTLKPAIEERLELLSYSVKHLKGEPINIEIGNISKYKNISWKIANELTNGAKIEEGAFAQSKYVETVTDVITNKKPNSPLATVNFDGILALIEELLARNGKLLAEILICEATQLKSENDRLLNKYNLKTEYEQYILKRGFDYWLGAVSDLIKQFFRSNNFVKFCPYCNLTEVEYNTTERGSGATTHQLDHFFDKDRYPLLACSFFNLVPSDGTCTGQTNKGSINFTDEFHLNPHRGGFVNEFVFKPILKGKKVKEIGYSIRAEKGCSIRKQMFGSYEELYEDRDTTKNHEKGNVNVFTLYSKYKGRTKKAQFVIDDLAKADKGTRAIKKFLNKMKMTKKDSNHAYKSWYERTIKTSFDSKDFNDEAYSKFNRDIHDYYYENDSKPRNEYIRNLIRK